MSDFAVPTGVIVFSIILVSELPAWPVGWR